MASGGGGGGGGGAPQLVTSGAELERIVAASWCGAPSPGSTQPQGALPCKSLHEGLTPGSAAAGARSAFEHARCAVWVVVGGGRVESFVPFANPGYRGGARREDMLGDEGVVEYAERKARALGRACPESMLPDVSRWWFNGHVVCNVMPPHVWGGYQLDAVHHMLSAAAGRDPTLRASFLFNKRDFPLLRRDGTWLGATGALAAAPPQSAGPAVPPVLSFFGGDGFADALLPPVDDWGLACGWEWMPEAERAGRADSARLRQLAAARPWAARRQVAVFRGSATGPGTTTSDNQRLSLAFASMAFPHILDAGITSWTSRDRKKPGDAAMRFVDPTALPLQLSPRLSMEEQMDYRYVVYVQGHAAAARMGTLLHLGCVVLRVRETTPAPRLWCDAFLRGVEVDSLDDEEWAAAHFVWVHDPYSVPDAVEALEAREDRCLGILRNAEQVTRLWWSRACMTSVVRTALADAASVGAAPAAPRAVKRPPPPPSTRISEPPPPPMSLQPVRHELLELPPPPLEPRAESRREFLFSMVPPALRARTAVDEVALFSVTEARTAENMARFILTHAGPRAVVTDATACVGGNVLALAAAGARVRAVELDPRRFRMLTHNLALWERVVPACGAVEAFGGDCLSIVPRLSQDVVFVDPPWGGPDADPGHAITLGGLPLVEACARLCATTRWLALKLPPTLDDSKLVSQLGARCGLGCVLRRTMGGGRMTFLLLSRRDPAPTTKRRRRGTRPQAPAAYDAPRPDGRGSTQGLRALNNFVKSVLITHSICVRGRDATSHAPRVLDLACGEAGDILKWDRERFVAYTGVDVSEGQMARARDRIAGLDRTRALRHIRGIELLRAAVGVDDLDARLGIATRFDCISVQFALHYMNRTRTNLMNVMDLVSRRLLARGAFIATLPCADAIRRACGPEGVWRNSLCTVRIAPDGASYTFDLAGCVPADEPEYFVSADLLRAAAAAAGLTVSRLEPLPDFARSMRRLPVYGDRARTMRVPDTLSPDEAAVAALYQVCVFTQPDGPRPTLSALPLEERVRRLVALLPERHKQ